MKETVLAFWFNELSPAQHWTNDPKLDKLIRDRFSKLHAQANRCELVDWRSTPTGRLAEIIVLDQFSRNIYRDSALAFASDPLALALSQEAISLQIDEALKPSERSFLYLPFMHSESKLIHQRAVELYQTLDTPSSLAFELKHKAIIDRFGRYPHRNEALGRASTPEERQFLTQPGSHF